MADLYALYQEMGLAGLIPHAIRENSKGWHMVVDKIRCGEQLYILKTAQNTPFLIIKDGVRQTPVFSSEQAAKDLQEEYARSRYNTTATALPQNAIDNVVEELHDMGVDKLFLDNSLSISLSAFSKLPTYDGHPTEDHLLRNHKLNGALFYCSQIAAAEMSNTEAEFQLGQAIKDACFLLPVQKGEDGNYYYKQVVNKAGEGTLLAFTDWRQSAMADNDDTALIVRFEELATLVEKHGTPVLLNPATCHLLLNRELMEHLKALSQVNSANEVAFIRPAITSRGHTASDARMEADPMPDFLR